jgi:transcriptional regulator with XRE-family HTH domain
MAGKAGLSRSTYIHYEQGNAVPGGLELIKLARALGKSPNYLLSGSEVFFGLRTPDAMPPAETAEAAVYRFAMMLPLIDRDTVEALSSVALAIIRAKLTKRQFALIQKVWTKTDAAMPALASQFTGPLEAFAEQLYPLKRKRKT